MLRPILAFVTLAAAAFLLAPTVSSVHEKVDALSINHELPWQIFKWIEEPKPPVIGQPDCDYKDYHLVSEIVTWPERLHKGDSYQLTGHVGIDELYDRGVYNVEVDVFLNDTKELPGVKLGTAKTYLDGTFTLSGTLPFDLRAEHYHFVAHAHESRLNCWILREHWSDPEVDIFSNTTISFDEPPILVAGREAPISGTLVDELGSPMGGEDVLVNIGGRTANATTDEAGRFVVPWTPSRAGNVTLDARYRGDEFYIASSNRTFLQVREEDFALDTDIVEFLRSQPTTLSGQVFVAEELRGENLTLEIKGARMVACEGCRASNRFSIATDEDGRFSVKLTAPSNETPGDLLLAFSGAGLKEIYTRNASLDVQPVVTLRARGTGLFSHGYALEATLADETGKPMDGQLAILAADTWTENRTGADGTFAMTGKTGCGRTGASAFHNATGHIRSARADDEMVVCSILTLIPGWLTGIPWWAFVLPPLIVAGAWLALRMYRERYAPTLSSGPPLALSFTEPDDAAAGFATVGETIEITAFLESPLPDGHRLRMGSWRAMEERPLDEKLRAHALITPSAMGDLPLRAEILDPRGRVVTRRTLRLRVIRYAHEIEARYLALRKRAGASDAVTPREFETWLRKHAPALDAETARRLVLVFEEADYSPRDAGRADFAVYLAAERGVQEVSPDAMV